MRPKFLELGPLRHRKLVMERADDRQTWVGCPKLRTEKDTRPKRFGVWSQSVSLGRGTGYLMLKSHVLFQAQSLGPFGSVAAGWKRFIFDEEIGPKIQETLLRPFLGKFVRFRQNKHTIDDVFSVEMTLRKDAADLLLSSRHTSKYNISKNVLRSWIKILLHNENISSKFGTRTKTKKVCVGIRSPGPRPPSTG